MEPEFSSASNQPHSVNSAKVLELKRACISSAAASPGLIG